MIEMSKPSRIYFVPEGDIDRPAPRPIDLTAFLMTRSFAVLGLADVQRRAAEHELQTALAAAARPSVTVRFRASTAQWDEVMAWLGRRLAKRRPARIRRMHTAYHRRRR